MNRLIQGVGQRWGRKQACWKGAALAVAVVLGLTVMFAAGPALAGGHEGHSRGGDAYETKLYGTVERLPQDRIGTWIVEGREIVVTADTRIKEKHGKAEAGAYVEVEGNSTGKTFTAFEIEVKRTKK